MSADFVRPVLLELLDDRVCHQHFDARDQRFVLEDRHGDRVHVAEIIRFDRANRVAEATAKAKNQSYRANDSFHGAGEGVASGAPDALEPGDPRLSNEPLEEPALLGGAVVVSGSNDAAGGSDASESAGGKGAELLPALPAGDCCLPAELPPELFFLSATA